VRGHGLQLPSPNILLIIGDSADVFDGTMITLAMLTLNLFHPGIYLREDGRSSPDQASLPSPEGTVLEDLQKPSIRCNQYPSTNLFPLHLRFYIYDRLFMRTDMLFFCIFYV
jgi:hypothetical protein